MKDYAHFIPGYTGFCPELPLHFGHTYGNATRHVILHHPHIRERLAPVHYRPPRDQWTGMYKPYCGKPSQYRQHRDGCIPPGGGPSGKEKMRCSGAAAVARTVWEEADRICCVYAFCVPKDGIYRKGVCHADEMYPRGGRHMDEMYPRGGRHMDEIYPRGGCRTDKIYPKRETSRCLPRECPAGPIHCPLLPSNKRRYCPSDYCRDDHRACRMPRVKPHRRGGVVPKYTGHITGLQFSFGESYGPASDRLLRRHHDCMTTYHRKL